MCCLYTLCWWISQSVSFRGFGRLNSFTFWRSSFSAFMLSYTGTRVRLILSHLTLGKKANPSVLPKMSSYSWSDPSSTGLCWATPASHEGPGRHFKWSLIEKHHVVEQCQPVQVQTGEYVFVILTVHACSAPLKRNQRRTDTKKESGSNLNIVWTSTSLLQIRIPKSFFKRCKNWRVSVCSRPASPLVFSDASLRLIWHQYLRVYQPISFHYSKLLNYKTQWFISVLFCFCFCFFKVKKKNLTKQYLFLRQHVTALSVIKNKRACPLW